MIRGALRAALFANALRSSFPRMHMPWRGVDAEDFSVPLVGGKTLRGKLGRHSATVVDPKTREKSRTLSESVPAAVIFLKNVSLKEAGSQRKTRQLIACTRNLTHRATYAALNAMYS